MNKIVTGLSAFILASSALPVVGRGLADWEIVCDGNRTARLSQVICLVTADNDELINVVLKDSSIDGVRSVTFQKFSGVESVSSGQNSIRILQIEGILRISNCRSGANLVISDLSGKVMGRYTIPEEAIDIDVRYLIPGTYIATINGYAIKFIKK